MNTLLSDMDYDDVIYNTWSEVKKYDSPDSEDTLIIFDSNVDFIDEHEPKSKKNKLNKKFNNKQNKKLDNINYLSEDDVTLSVNPKNKNVKLTFDLELELKDTIEHIIFELEIKKNTFLEIAKKLKK